MTQQFTYPPARYIAESQSYSRWGTIWLPLLAMVALWTITFANHEFFKKWMSHESTGLVEFLHALLPLFVMAVGLRLLFFKFIRRDKLLFFWCAAMAVGGLYLGGEEASWGQHYVGWTTPEFWQGINDQGETNIHNTLALFDQVPRAILVFGIVFTGIVNPWLLINRPELLPRRWDFTYPPLALRPLAFIVLATWIFLILRGSVLEDIWWARQMRPGELQETYIVWFLAYYALALYWRAKKAEQAMRDSREIT